MTDTKDIKIASIGELLVEFVCLDKDTRNAELSRYEGPFPSGAPAIFISQAAHQGAACSFFGAVGRDAFGDVVLNRLQDDGIDSHVCRDPDLPTGTAFVSYNSDGSRQFVFNIAHSAATRIAPIDEIANSLAVLAPDVLHISGSSLTDPQMMDGILDLCRGCHAAGVRISFDPNIRPELLEDAGYRVALDAILALSHYFFPSEEDFAVLFPERSVEEVATDMFAKGLSYFVLTAGAAGCQARTPDGQIVSQKGHRVDEIDATGAGDIFCATFVTKAQAGTDTLATALAWANAAGALSIRKLGPMTGISTPSQIRALLADP